MENLTIENCMEVNGGIHIHIGTLIAAVVVGAITGGPVGVGYVLTAAVMAKGVDNLTDMAVDQFGNPIGR